ncbi:hypothetical protein EWM64_g6203 [Hericium alpestre]|uniref:MYND-type domain-containing protein n=1 Tax=Hericium alpestre TaxID=135208 RepID=A0A4Y9ZUF4_9AGAM|nr:hypothetical protein EWM64_g6203 [Hericium alpestre]
MEVAVRNQKSASSSPCEQDRRKETKAKAKETKAKEAKASKPAKAVLDKASCLNCGKTCKLRVCKKCNRAAYCDAECQRTHWPEHKTYCATLDGRQEKLDRKILQLVFRAVNISELKESLALLFECLLDLRNHPENASQFIPTLYFKLVTPDQVPLEHGILLGEPLPETGLIPTLSHVIKPRWDELSALERQEMNRSLPQIGLKNGDGEGTEGAHGLVRKDSGVLGAEDSERVKSEMVKRHGRGSSA